MKKKCVGYPVFLILAAFLVLGPAVVAGCGRGGDPDEVKKVREVAGSFLEEAAAGDYGALFELIDTSDVPLLSVLTCKMSNQVPSIITGDKEKLRDMLVKYGGIQKMLGWMEYEAGKLGSAEVEVVRALTKDSYMVTLRFGGVGGKVLPMVVTRDDSGWGWDFSAYQALGDPEVTGYVADHVDYLLEDWRYDMALDALGAIGGLKAKYEMWLQGPMKKEMRLTDKQVKALKKGADETGRVPALIKKVEAEKAANP